MPEHAQPALLTRQHHHIQRRHFIHALSSSAALIAASPAHWVPPNPGTSSPRASPHHRALCGRRAHRRDSAFAGKGQRQPGRVIIENRPGGRGNIGVDLVAKAAPDGATIGIRCAATHAIPVAVYCP